MAYVYDINNIDTANDSKGQYIYTLKTSLISAGWLLKGSGNGPTGSSSNVATAGSAQATDYFNSPVVADTKGSWFRVRSPTTMSNGTFRELTFQTCRFSSINIGSTNDGNVDFSSYNTRTYRVKYSMCISGSGFFGGTISANSGTTPNAATVGDEYIVAGSGVNTDTGSVDISGELGGGALVDRDFSSTGFYWSTITNDEPPYDFAIFSFRKTSRNSTHLFSYSSLLQGSYETSDADPYVFFISGDNWFGSGRNQGYNFARGILGYGTEYQSMVELTRQATISIGQGHIAGEDNLLPGRFYRLSAATTPNGWKGFSTFFLDLTTYSSRLPGDTISVNSTRDKIILTNFSNGNVLSSVLPWNGSIPLT